MLTGHVAFKGVNPHFGESLDMSSLINMLYRLKMEVDRCLKQLDSGLVSCECGLLGPAPKPLPAVHNICKPRVVGPKEALLFKDKQKFKRGFAGPKPKVCFNPLVVSDWAPSLRVLAQL